MMNCYDEIRNDVMEALEEDTVKDILYSGDSKDTIIEDLYDYLVDDDYVTGNATGSYYCDSYKARQQCYNFSSDVREALEDYGYEEKLEQFKIFEILADEGYLNVDTMTLDYDLINEVLDEDEASGIFYSFEDVESLDFETIDVITRCHMLGEVLSDVIETILK